VASMEAGVGYAEALLQSLPAIDPWGRAPEPECLHQQVADRRWKEFARVENNALACELAPRPNPQGEVGSPRKKRALGPASHESGFRVNVFRPGDTSTSSVTTAAWGIRAKAAAISFCHRPTAHTVAHVDLNLR